MTSWCPRLLAALIMVVVTGCAGSTLGVWRPADDAATEPAIRAALGSLQNSALLANLAQTANWLETTEASERFPVQSIGQERVRLSLLALEHIVRSTGRSALGEAIVREFLVYEAEPVLYTGYYAPAFKGSLRATQKYTHPLYRTPSDMAVARRTRSEFERDGLLRGLELVWLADPFDAYTAQVNGSVRVILDDGSHINVGHNATNQRPYTSLGRLLIDEGRIPEAEMSMQRLRRFFAEHPNEFQRYAWRNERYVFFEQLDDAIWPRASTGLPLQPWVSIATDHLVVPAGCIAIVQTTLVGADGSAESPEPFTGFVLNHDTGGAIKGPGRVDLFMGIGPEAGEVAGRQVASGGLFLLLLRPERLDAWRVRLRSGR